MKIFFVIGLATLSYCYSLPQGVSGDPSIDELIANVVNDADTNKDGIITEVEAGLELMGQFDKNGNYELTSGEFVDAWSSTYGDSKETSRLFFEALDVMPWLRKGNGRLNHWDLIVHLGRIDSNASS